jgi:hypothetical protein
VYVRAPLIGGILGCAVLLGLARLYAPPIVLTRTFDARFEWDSVHGFQTFEFRDDNLGDHVGGRLWQYVVAMQTKPQLASYLRRAGFHKASGAALVRVARVIPVVLPDSWGSDGLDLDTDVTPLMRAADNADLDSVTKLLAGGADVNAKDWLGRTPLLHACMHGNANPNVLKALLAAGADPNAHDNRGTTPLLAAATGPRGEVGSAMLRELLAAGADVNAKDTDGATALMQAAAAGDAEAVTLLLESGANVGAQTDTGDTALSCAERYNHPEVAQVLRRAGARD